MLNDEYFTLEPNLPYVTFTCILLHSPRRKSTKGATSSGLATRSTYCRARHGTQESSLEKHKRGIEHHLVCPRTREKCLYIHNERHTIKLTFTHIPTGCNSCVENELLHVVLARGMEGWRDGREDIHMEGEVDWHELPVMYCFHRMPCTLKTSHNWPRSRSAIETHNKSDRQCKERERVR